MTHSTRMRLQCPQRTAHTEERSPDRGLMFSYPCKGEMMGPADVSPETKGTCRHFTRLGEECYHIWRVILINENLFVTHGGYGRLITKDQNKGESQTGREEAVVTIS